MITFTVPGDAVSFGTKNTCFRRNGKTIRGTRKTDAAADWQATVRDYAAIAWRGRPLLEGPVEVTIIADFAMPKSMRRKRKPTPRTPKDTTPDGDKIDRLVMDALQGVAYANDSQVAFHSVRKFWAAQGEPARTVVGVRAISPEPAQSKKELLS